MKRNTEENIDSKEPKLDRRSILGLAGAAISASAASIAGPASAATPRSDIVMLDAVALSSAIHTRQLSCVEVMTAYLDHIERLNPKVNAIVALEDRVRLISQATERDAQLARGESMRPLHGFPHAVKDLQPVKGIRPTQGSSILKISYHPPTALWLSGCARRARSS
jgi:amidase